MRNWIRMLLVAPMAFASPLAAAADFTVTMKDGAYHPASLSAATCDQLIFVNDSDADHGVFSPTAGYAFDLGPLKPGEQASLPLGRAGRFEVECVFHPDMLLQVEVK